MKLNCIATGSKGNCYILESSTGEKLILDCGISIKEIKKGLNFDIKNAKCALVTHGHKDHSLSAEKLSDVGIPVFAPYISQKPMAIGSGSFTVQAFDLTTVDGRWTHTNTDGTECPCYGFLITHDEMGRMLYITDCEVIKWRFKNINYILLGTNYDKDLVNADDVAKNNHVFRGHLEIGTACDFVKANNSDSLQNVIMCHLSSGNADKDSFIERMEKAAPQANVDIAESGKSWNLQNPNSCPF